MLIAVVPANVAYLEDELRRLPNMDLLTAYSAPFKQ